MIPRLKSSKKWTAFPKEYTKQIQAVFNENFAQYLDNAQILIEGRIFPEEILLRVGYLENGRLAQYNFEVSMGYSRDDQDTVEKINNCVDAAAGMMMDYLEKEGDVDFPYVWKEFPFQGKKLYVQFSTENSTLEQQANKLLGLTEEELYHDADEEADEDALSRAEHDEELSPPRDEDKLAATDEDEEFEDLKVLEETEEDEEEDAYSEDDQVEDHFAHLDQPSRNKGKKLH